MKSANPFFQTSYQLTGRINAADRYVVVVHYYQPNHVMFPAKVTLASGDVITGSVKFRYCPHASGCRAVVNSNAANGLFLLNRRSVPIEVEIPQNSSVWIVSWREKGTLVCGATSY